MFRDFTQTSIPAEGIQDEKVTLQSKPALIIVKPLPGEDMLRSFNGAVGNFTLEAALEKNSFTTDDAGKLRIAISGAGNMSLIIAPDIDWPGGIEHYEPRAKEQLNKRAVPVSGTKVFEYPFTIAKPGNYIIPAIGFSFFNVRENRYKTVTTNPLSIVVTRGIGKKPVTMNENIVKTGKEQFFDTLFTNRWLIIVPLAILMLTGLFISFQKENKNQATPPAPEKIEEDTAPEGKETVTEIAVNPLILTEEKLVLRDSPGFYKALNNELMKFLASKLQIPLATINKKRIAEEADKKGITVYTTLQIQQLLDDIEWQLYTPLATEEKMQDMYNNADAIVHALNNQGP